MAVRIEIRRVLNIGRKALAKSVMRPYKSHHFVALALSLMLTSTQIVMARRLCVELYYLLYSRVDCSRSEANRWSVRNLLK